MTAPTLLPSQPSTRSASRIWYFGAIPPPAYPLAYLRIGIIVAVDAARLATDRLARLWSDGTLTRWTALPNFLAIAFAFSFRTSISWSH